MDRSELIHMIFLHLPLNIFWRMAGWNRIMNKVFMQEQFWKEKCEREFHLMPENIGIRSKVKEREGRIDSYRIYYMIRTRNVKSNLYLNQSNFNLNRNFEQRWSVEPVLRGISSTIIKYLDNNVYLVVIDKVLYRIYIDSILYEIDDRVAIQSEVDKISYKEIGRARIPYCWIQMKDGGNLLMEVDSEPPSYMQFPIKSSLSIIDWIYIDKDRYLVLFSDGGLAIQSEQSCTVVRRGVLQFIVHYQQIIASYKDGFIEVMDKEGTSSIRVYHPHLYIRSYGMIWIIHRLDGAIDLLADTKLKSFTDPYERKKLSTPLRDYFMITSRGSSHVVVTTIDGLAHLNMSDYMSSLLGGYPKLKYHGVTFLHNQYLLGRLNNQ